MSNKWLVVWGLSGFITLTSCTSFKINEPEYESKKASALFIASNRASGERQLWQANKKGDKLSLFKLPANKGTGNADVGNLVSLGDAAIFTAYSAEYGRELWRTDGTESGTTLLKDTLPGPSGGMNDNGYGSTGENPLTSATTDKGEVFFWSSTAKNMTLWKTNGTSKGTIALKSFPRSVSHATTRRLKNATLPRLVASGRMVFFRADDGQHGTEFWYSDGTKTGTKLLLDATKEVPDKNGYLPNSGRLTDLSFQLTEQYLYFTTKSLVHHDYKQPFSTTLWRIARNTGNPEKIKQLSSNSSQSAALLYADESSVYYYHTSEQSDQVDLWRVNPETKNTKYISRLGGKETYMGGGLYNPSKSNDFLYFWFAGADNASEFWRTNGDKTQRLLTVPGIEGHHNSRQYAFADQVFFSGAKSYNNPPTPAPVLVWRSDSKSPVPESVAVTLDQAKDQPKIAGHLRIQSYFFIEVNDHLLFSIPDEKREQPIVRAISEENPQQTVVMGRFNSFIPVAPSVDSANDGLLFINGDELWHTDGSASGTRKITAFSPRHDYWKQKKYWTNGFELPDITPVKLNNGKLLFSLNDRRYGTELWVSDGTHQGTKLVKDINTKLTGPGISDLVQLGNSWYFTREGRIWFSDGSPANTKVVGQIPGQQMPRMIIAAPDSESAYALTRPNVNVPNDKQLYTLWRLDNDQATKLRTFTGFTKLVASKSAVYVTQSLIDSHRGEKQRRFVLWAIGDEFPEPIVLNAPEKPYEHPITLSGTIEEGFLYSIQSLQGGKSSTFVFNETSKTSKRIETPEQPGYFNTGQRLIRLTTEISQTGSISVFDSDKQDFKLLTEFPNRYSISAMSTDKGLYLFADTNNEHAFLWYLGDDQQKLQLVKQFPSVQSVRLSKALKQRIYLSIVDKQSDISMLGEFTQVWISDGTEKGTRKVTDRMQIVN